MQRELNYIHFHNLLVWTLRSPKMMVNNKIFVLSQLLELIDSYELDVEHERSVMRRLFSDPRDDGTERTEEEIEQMCQNCLLDTQEHIRVTRKRVHRAINLLVHQPDFSEINVLWCHVFRNLEFLLVNAIESQQKADRRIGDLEALKEDVEKSLSGNWSERAHFIVNSEAEQKEFLHRAQRTIDKLTEDPEIDSDTLYSHVFTD